MKSNNICFFTGSRSEFGISKYLLEHFKNNKQKFSLVISGSHLIKNFGNTYNEIKENKIKIKHKIKLKKFNKILNHKLFSDSFFKYSQFLEKNKYEFAVIIGDRIESFSFALACFFNKTKIIHLHGGELTQGSIDNYFRNIISSLSNYHFVSNDHYKKRLIRLGQEPKKIFNIGSLSLDQISNYKLISKKNFCNLKKINYEKKLILVSYHPLSSKQQTLKEINSIIKTCKNFKDVNFIFTAPSMDQNHDIVKKKIQDCCIKNSNFYFYQSLGHFKYTSVLKFCDIVLGNSSSAIIEAPYLKTPSINIGNRQLGREMSLSVHNVVKANSNELTNLIKKILLNKNKIIFQNKYAKKNSSKKFLNIFKNKIIKDKSVKLFYETKFWKQLNNRQS